MFKHCVSELIEYNFCHGASSEPSCQVEAQGQLERRFLFACLFVFCISHTKSTCSYHSHVLLDKAETTVTFRHFLDNKRLGKLCSILLLVL